MASTFRLNFSKSTTVGNTDLSEVELATESELKQCGFAPLLPENRQCMFICTGEQAKTLRASAAAAAPSEPLKDAIFSR